VRAAPSWCPSRSLRAAMKSLIAIVVPPLVWLAHSIFYRQMHGELV
jgi:hypothetical protein